jgi:hypothetical protein
MPTLVLPPRYTLDTRVLWKAAIFAGWDVERLSSWQAPVWLKAKDVAIYGEPLFVSVVAQSLGITLQKPPLDWVASLPRTYSQRRIEFKSLAEARLGPFPAFIKPAEDKFFVVQVFNEAGELPAPDESSESIPTLVAEPVVWGTEYRCFVLERNVLTACPYSCRGALLQAEDGSWPADEAERQEALAFADSLLADRTVGMPEALVIDVGQIEERGWAVVEANPAWGSGIYGCDPDAVLKVIHRACRA